MKSLKIQMLRLSSNRLTKDTDYFSAKFIHKIFRAFPARETTFYSLPFPCLLSRPFQVTKAARARAAAD
jgi:hypothetical protein